MKKALMMASVASMIDLFNMANVEVLKELGYKVDVACNFESGSITSQERVDRFKKKLNDEGFIVHNIPVPRSVFSLKGIFISYRVIKKLCDNNNYELVHCHSPIGGIIARLACRKARKKGTRVIYTAHGFHFYKGAPLINWLLYYPVERIFAHWTDVLITINTEDYDLAKRKMKAGKVLYVPGIGVDLSKFDRIKTDNRAAKRAELGIPEDATLLLSVGELNKNKNHEIVIRAISGLDVYYMIAGQGDKKDYLEFIASNLGMAERVKLLGYRNDVDELYSIADIFIFPSYREGLPVSLMESMCAGLPCVVSKVRGNTDLIIECQGGLLFDPSSVDECRKTILTLFNSDMRKMGIFNREIIRKFDIETITDQMKTIYSEQ